MLNGDQLSPLLKGRGATAIKQYKKEPCPIIFSGGQGEDETIEEATAMANYALENGVAKQHVILEGQSLNTLENLKFSKKLIQELSLSDKGFPVIVTSNYHCFRAGIYGRRAGLKAKVLGAKTAKYFLPSALIREYIALLSLNRKANITAIGLIFITYILWLIFS